MPRERSATREKREFVNARVATVAARQFGVLDTGDLHGCGLSDDALAHPNLEFKAWCLAAVKACGPGAAAMKTLRRGRTARHEQMLARADDRAKQRIFEALGYTVIRTSWAEITPRPDRMIARVSAARAG